MADKSSFRMKRKDYEKALRKLQIQLWHLQDRVKEKGARTIIFLEGHEAAGKGETIKVLTGRVSPRVFKIVALPLPSDRQKSQMFFPQNMDHFPAGGEITIFDRLGVECVREFCSENEHKRFLELCPPVEKYIVGPRVILIKIRLEVQKEEQAKRFDARVNDPLRQWKLNLMDVESLSQWYTYSKVRDQVSKATDNLDALWVIMRSGDKQCVHLICIAHILKTIPFKKIKRSEVKLPRRSSKGAYADQSSTKEKNFVAEIYN